jgi:hypothetical protein
MFTLSKEISISWHCPFKPVLCLHFQKKYPSRDTVPLNLFFAFLKWRKYFFRCLSLLFLSAKLTVIGFNTVVHSTEYTESQSPLDCRRWLPPPSPRKRVYPSTPPPGSKGGHTLACEKGMGGADSDEGTDTMVLWCILTALLLGKIWIARIRHWGIQIHNWSIESAYLG